MFEEERSATVPHCASAKVWWDEEWCFGLWHLSGLPLAVIRTSHVAHITDVIFLCIPEEERKEQVTLVLDTLHHRALPVEQAARNSKVAGSSCRLKYEWCPELCSHDGGRFVLVGVFRISSLVWTSGWPAPRFFAQVDVVANRCAGEMCSFEVSDDVRREILIASDVDPLARDFECELEHISRENPAMSLRITSRLQTLRCREHSSWSEWYASLSSNLLLSTSLTTWLFLSDWSPLFSREVGTGEWISSPTLLSSLSGVLLVCQVRKLQACIFFTCIVGGWALVLVLHLGCVLFLSQFICVYRWEVVEGWIGAVAWCIVFHVMAALCGARPHTCILAPLSEPFYDDTEPSHRASSVAATPRSSDQCETPRLAAV